MPSSFFLSFINPGLSSVGRVPRQDVLDIGLVHKLAERWIWIGYVCGWIPGTCLYIEDDIDGPCVEVKQVRNTQIDIGSG